MTPQIYQRLLNPDSIRLLEIQPGNPGSALACRMIQVSSIAHDSPQFEALSYVWGSADKPETIILNDCADFAITQSLHDALHRLRLPDRPRLVWADAICINQDDIDERNRQVRIMRNIYAAASKVCVWLGADVDGDIDRALVLMAAIVQTCEVNARNRGRRWDDLVAEDRFQLVPLTLLGRYGDIDGDAVTDSALDSILLYWNALRNFFARSWFTRVWCVQEIVMAQNSIILCDDTEIPWHVVELTAMWLNSQHMHYDFNVPSLIENIDIYKPLMMSEAADPVLRCKTLVNALRTFQDFQATDPRDKIYAILGITDHDELAGRVPIKYEESVTEVYIKTVEAALKSQSDLYIIACVQHPDTFEPDPNFPSWVPRWDNMVADATMLTTEIDVDDFDWRASGDVKVDEFEVSASRTTLELKGLTFDSVSFVSIKMDYKDFDSLLPSSKPSEILSLWRRFIDPHTTTIEGISKIISFATALTCETDVDYNHVMDFVEVEDRDEFFTDFLAYVMQLHDQEDDISKQLQTEQVSSSVKDDCSIEHKDTHAPKEDTRPSSFPSMDGDPARYRTAASRMCDQRRFFMTSQGYMGLGPASTQEGDVIVVLFGGRVPFMLRKTNTSSDSSSLSNQQSSTQKDSESLSYYLLGEAFVQEIMRGQMIDDMAAGTRTEEIFRLV